ncbi:hypothetical protein Lal_00035069 [Lupinus albus]|nr:hypothetical protein Lal_00035069 [Lupinus albus]
MKFIYILAGWEDSIANSRVLKDVISLSNGLRVPQVLENEEAIVNLGVDKNIFESNSYDIRDDNENRTYEYPSKPNPNLTRKTRCNWVRILPKFKF